MKADIIKIGNSKGIRIPAVLLKECGIVDKVEIEVRHNNIVLRPVRSPRTGWAAAFKRMNQNNDDFLLIDEDLDFDFLEDYDR